MQTILLAVHLVIALFLIGLVMLQKSEGGALGIGGGGGNLFSARGVGNTLTRLTAMLAAAFFATSIALTMLASHRGGSSIVTGVPVQSAPATDGTTATGTPQAPAAPATGGDTGGSALLPKLDGGGKPAVPATP
ncbi:MAG: preprotein translocase subunit SecG [Alphaproteobacteria bacterium]|nr:preprotein translocase subunit SecG [Alphaproteobacteria bacterium]